MFGGRDRPAHLLSQPHNRLAPRPGHKKRSRSVVCERDTATDTQSETTKDDEGEPEEEGERDETERAKATGGGAQTASERQTTITHGPRKRPVYVCGRGRERGCV